MKHSEGIRGSGGSAPHRGRRRLERPTGWPFVSGGVALLLLLCLSADRGGLEAQGLNVVEGTIEAYYEDSYSGPRLIHELNTGTRRHRLQAAKGRRLPELMSGDRVRARGTLTGPTTMRRRGGPADSGQTMMLGGGGTGDSGVTTLALASPYTFGPQQTLVILINFTNDTSQPYTAATAQSVTFTDVNNFYDEASFQQTSLNGIVAGWFTIAATNTTCSSVQYNDWANKADTAAFNAGVDVTAFPRRVYAFPYTPACSWWGLGTIGGGAPYPGLPSRSWINGDYSTRVVAHELGHNFGAAPPPPPPPPRQGAPSSSTATTTTSWAT